MISIPNPGHLCKSDNLTFCLYSDENTKGVIVQSEYGEKIENGKGAMTASKVRFYSSPFDRLVVY